MVLSEKVEDVNLGRRIVESMLFFLGGGGGELTL